MELSNWLVNTSNKVSGFISKFNIFKGKSLDIGVNLDTSGVQEFNNIALSGQYYNARTPRAESVFHFLYLYILL